MTSRHTLFAALVCAAASVVMLSPFMNLAHLDSALHTGDGRLYAWAIAWVAHALTHGLPVFDANMFFPAREALAQTDHYFALGLLGAPLSLATGNAVLVFNVLQLAGPAVTAFAHFQLLRAWTGDWLASLAGGLLFGLSFFALLHNAHLGLTWAAGLPWALLLLDRWWQQPTWTRLAALWIVCVLSALMSWYLAVMLALLVATRMLILAVTAARDVWATRIPQIVAALTLGAAVLLPFAAPYLGRVSGPGEAASLAACIGSYLTPPENTVPGRWLVSRGMITAYGIWGERTLYLGWAALACACLGLLYGGRAAAGDRRAQIWTLAAVLALGAALSFGPSSTGLSPYDVLAHLPGFSGFRASARYALLVAFAIAGLAAIGMAWLRRVAPRTAPLLITGVVALTMAERFVVDFPAGQPVPEVLPDVYARAREDGARAAIALPMYAGQAGWFMETDYLLYSTTAGFLPLANGYGRWAPPEYLAMAEAMRTFPSRASADALRFYGVTHAIFHGRRFGDAEPALLAQIRASTDYVIAAERGHDLLLRVAAATAALPAP